MIILSRTKFDFQNFLTWKNISYTPKVLYFGNIATELWNRFFPCFIVVTLKTKLLHYGIFFGNWLWVKVNLRLRTVYKRHHWLLQTLYSHEFLLSLWKYLSESKFQFTFGWSYVEINIWAMRTQNMGKLIYGQKYEIMASSKHARTHHHVHIFLHIFLVLKVQLNAVQKLGTTK